MNWLRCKFGFHKWTVWHLIPLQARGQYLPIDRMCTREGCKTYQMDLLNDRFTLEPPIGR